ncbi:MAG: carbohydrate kinase family protein [Anaerolineae bacterium]
MPRLICLAGMVTDLIAEVTLPIMAGVAQDARPMRFEAGASANVMIAAARLGISVQALGALGTDPAGTLLLEVLRDEGIDTSLIDVSRTTISPLTLALIDHQSKQHVFIGNVGQGDPPPFTAQIADALRQADALYWQGYVLHETQISPLIDPVLEAARARDIPIYFDSGPTIRSIAADRVRRAVQQSTIIRMTEDELPLAAEGKQGADAMRYLFDLGVEAVITTRGAAGVALFRPDLTLELPSLPVQVVDTVGAGDSFNAGFLYGLLHGYDWRERLIIGNGAGAAAVQKAGAGRHVPTCAEIKSILEQTGVKLELPC